jgi:NADH:ubiquinone oxidoreductase subunit F (NADH-binding)
VVANGFEADPGAQVDRTLMELDPHVVVEGTAIAAWVVGAELAVIAVSSSAPVAAERLRVAVEEAEARGYIGGVAGGRSLRIEVREVTGSFVVGEETVLLRALEGQRAQPDQRPPHPSRSGLWGKPTVVNNVKTLATVPWIVAHGAGAYNSLGSAETPGTTLVQLGGVVRKAGVAEVPLGATIREVLDGPGGSTQGSLKAVLAGGPTGAFLPPDALDTSLTYEGLRGAGAITGSGTLLALDESACLVDVATIMTRYLNDNACGKTIPCRIGTRRLAELGSGFCTGHARPSDAGLLADLAADVRDAALCGLEADAGNPLLSVMRYFAPEFEAHSARGECPAGVCQPLSLAGAASS